MPLDKFTIQQLVEELEKRLLSVDAAAMFLNTHVSYVWRLAKIGRLNPVKLFGRSLFTRTELSEEAKRRRLRRERIRLGKAKKKERPEGYSGWNVRELQRECKYRKLRVRGRKQELIRRLEENDTATTSPC